MDCYNPWHTCLNVSYIMTLDWFLNLSSNFIGGDTLRSDAAKVVFLRVAARVNDSREVGLQRLGFACVRF